VVAVPDQGLAPDLQENSLAGPSRPVESTEDGVMQRRRLAAVCSVMLLAACENWGPHESVSSPSADPSLTATIGAPVVPLDGSGRTMTPVIPFECSRELQFTGPVDIAMTAAHDVDLNQVTLRLVDRSAIPSATNVFSHTDLTEDFGSTQVPAGAVRTLRFHTRLPCGVAPPRSLAAEIRFLESSGRRNTITVTAPFDVTVNVSNNN